MAGLYIQAARGQAGVRERPPSTIIESQNASRFAALFFLVASAAASAQIPVTKEPHHRVVFENSQLRILDVNLPPGETTLDHSHDRDVATIAISNGATTRMQLPGQPWTDRPRRSLGNIETSMQGKPTSHTFQNVGQTTYQLFAVENLKPSGWSTTAALTAAATMLAKESRSFRVYTVALGKDRQQTSHTHQVPTIVMLLSGKVMSEGRTRRPRRTRRHPSASSRSTLLVNGSWSRRGRASPGETGQRRRPGDRDRSSVA